MCKGYMERAFFLFATHLPIYLIEHHKWIFNLEGPETSSCDISGMTGTRRVISSVVGSLIALERKAPIMWVCPHWSQLSCTGWHRKKHDVGK